jgi:ATP-binding cassette subfamily B protein
MARPFIPMLGLGVGAALLTALIKVAVPQLLDGVVSHSVSAEASRWALWIGVGVVALLGACEAALVALRRRFVVMPGCELEASLRIRLFEHLTQLSASFHDHWTGGQLLARSVSDVRRFIRWLSFGLSMTVLSFVTLGVGMTLMALTDWLLGLVYVAAAVPAFAASMRARRRYAVLSRRSQDQVGDLGTTIEESVQGIRVLKAYGREQEALEDFGDQAAELRVTELGKARQRAFITLVMSALPDGALALCLLVGIHRVGSGGLTTGELLAFFATATILAGPLERLADQFAMSMDASTAIDRYLETVDLPSDLTDPPVATAVPEGPGLVELRSVSFSYPGAEEPVLRDLDLVLPPGETIALVGLTGTGKSTLAQMIARFHDPVDGAVLIDGVDLRDLNRHDLRRIVSIAFSDPVLFSASIRDNVVLGRPDAGDDEVRVALDVAQASFVSRLPGGWDTRIGEDGMSLSGGQRQRLSLARAFLARPRVLILDDPLSALDVRTEAAVAARLREHLTTTTTLIVANRPSTVHVADRVAVLHEGRIVDLGAHHDLVGRSEIYRQVLSGAPAAGSAGVDSEVVTL